MHARKRAARNTPPATRKVATLGLMTGAEIMARILTRRAR